MYRCVTPAGVDSVALAASDRPSPSASSDAQPLRSPAGLPFEPPPRSKIALAKVACEAQQAARMMPSMHERVRRVAHRQPPSALTDDADRSAVRANAALVATRCTIFNHATADVARFLIMQQPSAWTDDATHFVALCTDCTHAVPTACLAGGLQRGEQSVPAAARAGERSGLIGSDRSSAVLRSAIGGPQCGTQPTDTGRMRCSKHNNRASWTASGRRFAALSIAMTRRLCSFAFAVLARSDLRTRSCDDLVGACRAARVSARCGPFRAKPHVATQCNVLQHSTPCCNVQHCDRSRLRAPQCPSGRKPVRCATGILCEYSVRTLATLCLDTAAKYSASTDVRTLSAASALLLRCAARRSVLMCHGGDCRPLHHSATWQGHLARPQRCMLHAV